MPSALEGGILLLTSESRSWIDRAAFFPERGDFMQEMDQSIWTPTDIGLERGLSLQ